MPQYNSSSHREKRKARAILPEHKIGPLFDSVHYKDTKDPCPVFDGKLYHIFGSGGDVRYEEWKILHATAPRFDGPWTEEESVVLNGLAGKKVAAPGVIYEEENSLFHMFVQTDFTTSDSSIEYLVSKDGKVFDRVETVLSPSELQKEIALYDPHPAVFKNEKYIVYSATEPEIDFFVPRPDIYLAKSETDSWKGPWKRLGKIIDHEDIADHHNRKDDPIYEWGIEGPQLVPLSNGQLLLNATCFLPKGAFGTRQRVFFALADTIEGPYHTLGPVLSEELDTWESGENGHAAILRDKGKLHLFYQGRSKEHRSVTENNWRYGIATFNENIFL